MGKHKHFKVKGFLNFSYETEIHAFPETWEKQISIVLGNMGKHRYFKFMGLGQAEIRKIPKTWEKGILIIWEKYGKKDIPKLQFSQKL